MKKRNQMISEKTISKVKGTIAKMESFEEEARFSDKDMLTAYLDEVVAIEFPDVKSWESKAILKKLKKCFHDCLADNQSLWTKEDSDDKQ